MGNFADDVREVEAKAKTERERRLMDLEWKTHVHWDSDRKEWVGCLEQNGRLYPENGIPSPSEHECRFKLERYVDRALENVSAPRDLRKLIFGDKS